MSVGCVIPNLEFYISISFYWLCNSGLVGTILMNLPKAYDCLPHEIISAKFGAYGVSKSSLSLLLDYWTSRKHRVKIGSLYSVWNEIKRGEDLSNILENLKHCLKILLKKFRINSLQANPGKFKFMILRKKKWNSVKLIINTTEIEESILNHLTYQQGVRKVQLILIFSTNSCILYIATFRAKTSAHLQAVSWSDQS